VLVKLTLERIVDAGMHTFAEHGYAGLSMRQVADRLGVHAGSLYYHVRNKEQLLFLLADRVGTEAYEAGDAALAALPPGAEWQQQIDAQLTALRTTLRAHPGAPLLLAGAPAMLTPGALSLMERLLDTLQDAGIRSPDSLIAADTLLSYVTGFTLQEDAESHHSDPPDADVLADLTARWPRTLSTSRSFDSDELFRRSIHLQCAAIATLIVGAAVL
jgi:TetR/AcrR family tetracycline transcriptional repressor